VRVTRRISATASGLSDRYVADRVYRPRPLSPPRTAARSCVDASAMSGADWNSEIPLLCVVRKSLSSTTHAPGGMTFGENPADGVPGSLDLQLL